ncbi:hypothetical protein [Actinomadura formosensis]|uniref:hypothetical protein n=1 Tax=Actinomadura formosensis TaxID=60706 RepID=UPI003D8BCA82
MLCRSAVKPVFIGLGAAAVLAAGGTSAIAAPPSPSGSASPSASRPATTGRLAVSISPHASEAGPGDRVTLRTHIEAVDGRVSGIKVERIVATPQSADATVESRCLSPFHASDCTIEKLKSGESANVESTVSVPKSTKKTVTVTVTVIVSATGLKDSTPTATVTYVVPEQSPTPTPTKSPTASPTKKPTPTPTKKPAKPSPSHTSSSGTSHGGSGGGGGSSSSGGSSSTGTGTSTSGYVPPTPNSSFDAKPPEVALPQIQAPSPSVAPSPVPGSGTPQSRLQGNKAPVAQDLTFERMASTQIAWLAALLVAFSLLLTQLRLGRRHTPAAAAKRVRGTHRRPRRGMFGK